MSCCGCWKVLVDEIRRPRRRGRQIRRAKYNEREYSIEFENLIEEEDFNPSARHVFSDQEKELVAQGKFDALFEQQRKFDAEIDEKLRKQEEDLRLEEEAFFQAKREAAKVNKQTKAKQQTQQVTVKETKSTTWSSTTAPDNDSADVDFEDFDAFLEKVKARSLSSKALAVDDGDDDGSFEAVLKLGVEATKRAGEATTALEPQFSDDDEEINILSSTSPAIV